MYNARRLMFILEQIHYTDHTEDNPSSSDSHKGQQCIRYRTNNSRSRRTLAWNAMKTVNRFIIHAFTQIIYAHDQTVIPQGRLRVQ